MFYLWATHTQKVRTGLHNACRLLMWPDQGKWQEPAVRGVNTLQSGKISIDSPICRCLIIPQVPAYVRERVKG